MPAVVLLTAKGESGQIAAQYLARQFPDFIAIVEQPESRGLFLRRRLKRLGAVTVFGQILFMVWTRMQARRSRARIVAIHRSVVSGERGRFPIIEVPSANSPECIEALKHIGPAVVLVDGTRILSADVMKSVPAPFVNYHAGITPRYRGVHGGYWALASGDAAHCGATVHLIDEGIDTGAVLYQVPIAPVPDDNFSTYPHLQLAAALPLLAQAANDAIAGRLSPTQGPGPSRLWSHPTIWGYLATGLRRGVW